MAKSASGTKSNKLLGLLLLIALGLVVTAAVDLFFVTQNASHDDEFLGYAAQQALFSQSISKNADEALRGNLDAFKSLLNAREQMDRTLNRMAGGNPDTLLPPATGPVLSEVQLLQNTWDDAKKSTQTILDARDSLIIANKAAQQIGAQMPAVLKQWDTLTDTMVKTDATRSAIYHAARQGFYGERIARNVQTVVRGGGNVDQAVKELPADVAFFERVVQAMYDGAPGLGIPKVTDTDVRRELQQADTQFGQVGDDLQTVTSMLDKLQQVQAAASNLHALSGDMLAHSQAIRSSYQRAIDQRLFKPIYGYVLGGLGMLVFIVIVFVYQLSGEARKAAAAQLEQNERNQDAILRLLDELGSLADGDLSVEVTVTEDITGAIADSINYALEALRDLVRTINTTALQVDAAARQTQATATHLAEASDNQSKQITSASGAITQMATSIEQVSANAERSSKVAQQSVEIAHKGGEAVRRTIDGMNAIRETIQETSKRIKRLGESSQEIGDIVELINDIAEQTNILALNAAIQASMAGEAGRGFAVVADEVQRLAERSANATRQIEALVKTIQTDTNEAVISMEQSTAGVVSGAQLAENAGSALDEIEKVSNHIATLIQSISNAARQQATAATDVSHTMNVIQEITSQTAEGTNATAQSIGKLAALATELRKSVAGFKLPGQDAGETMVTAAAAEQA